MYLNKKEKNKMAEENKQKLIDETLKSIEKQFGKVSIMKLGDKV